MEVLNIPTWGGFVRSPEAHVADDDPSKVQLLGEWGVMWTVYLASYFVYFVY